MKRLHLLLLVLLSSSLATLAARPPAPQGQDPPPEVAERLSEARRLQAEGSHALAHGVYLELRELELDAETRGLVELGLADSAWRSAAATADPDPSRLDAARAQLEELLAAHRRPEQRDRLFAELSESLADFHHARRGSSDWGRAWPHYQAALGYWAASSELELARGRYLALVWKLVEPSGVRPAAPFLEHGVGKVPLGVLENAARVAQEPAERARASLLLAVKLSQQGLDPRSHRRIHAAFEDALEHAPGTEWLGEALWLQGRWLESSGRLVVEPRRGARAEPDYVAALAAYRRLVEELPRGESRWHEPARRRISEIVEPTVSVRVDRAFLPGSRIRFDLSWRNAPRVELALLPFDPARHVDLAESDTSTAGAWLDAVDTQGLEAAHAWEHATADEGRHAPGSATIDLERELAPGAYVLVASAQGRSARALVLVSRGGLVVKGAQGELVAWLCDAESGLSVPDAPLRLWQRESGRTGRWLASDGRTDETGLARFTLRPGVRWSQALVLAGGGEHASFAHGNLPGAQAESRSWRIQAHTDRAAYRPGHEVHFKLVARQRGEAGYTTPEGSVLRVVLVDPRGQTHSERNLTLNAFGSAWGSFTTAEADTLGEYTARFLLPHGASEEGEKGAQGTSLGSAKLFRLEEYRLPEFRVEIEPAGEEGVEGEEGAPRLFRLGEPVEAEVRAAYYFGGAVAGAEVEVLVHQRPYFPRPPREHDYPWLHPDEGSGWDRWWGGPGQLVHRETLRTDEQGVARLSFPTPAGAPGDQEYTLEARVIDLSRREVAGRGTVRVTHQAHHVHGRVDRRVVGPGQRATATFMARDANGRGVAAAGTVTLVRRRWVEVWIDPFGVRREGQALEAARLATGGFPPPPPPGLPRWRPVQREWVEELVASTALATDAEGRATWTVAPPRTGYHELVWRGEDRWGTLVEARVPLWVAADERLELAYRGGGVTVVVDRDSFRSGERVPVLIALDASNRHVLFSVQADRLIEARVVPVSGDAKLLMLEIDERHVPDVHLSAAAFIGARLETASQRVVVPPIEHFYEVELAAEPGEVLPGGRGTLTVRTTDVDGEPVAAEVSLSLVDRSVSAIQEDYAGDPRQHFFGDLRGDRVTLLGLLGGLPLVRLIEDEEGQVRDERQVLIEKLREGLGEDDVSYLGVGALLDERVAWDALAGARLEGRRARGGDAPELREQLRAMGYADAEQAAPEAGAAPEPGAEISVRTDFRETALWLPAVLTDEEGRASVELDYPESLTEWQATARAVGRDARFGWGSATSRTRQPLVVRVQAPRFFVVGDECLVSLEVTNRTEESLSIAPALHVEGLRVLGFVQAGELVGGAPARVELGAGQGLRLDWRVAAEAPGTARLRGTASAGELSDGVERSYPVVPHGLDVLVARSGRVDGEGVVVSFDLPAERAPGTTEVFVQVAPNLALTMLDALPYLVDFPYGCTEQTLSRFLPAVVVKRTLSELGLSPELVAARSFGGITPGAEERVMRETGASLAQLDEVVRRGLERLYGAQLASGGFGWWPGGREDLFMSGYVVLGLSLAREAGAPVRADALDAGARFLDLRLVDARHQPELRAFMLHALAAYRRSAADRGIELPHAARAARELFAERERLNAYGKALLLLSLRAFGGEDATGDIATLARNLENGVIVDRAPDASVVPVGGQAAATAFPRAHWGADGIGYRWSQDGVEATAFALWALLEAEEHSRTSQPSELAEQAVEWLIANRRGAQWKNTRDTAIVVLALERYVRARGLLERPVAYEVLAGGRSLAALELAGDELLAAPARFRVPDELVASGENRIEIRRGDAEGPMWFAIEARFFSEEEPIPARGNELFVRRTYLELTPRETLLAGPRLARAPLESGGEIESGRRLEVVLLVEAKVPLEYLVFEDLKPAGLEATVVKSGEPLSARRLTRAEVQHRLGRGEAAYAGELAAVLDAGGAGERGERVALHQELRDRKVALFADRLPEGFWEIRYELRAETPGSFHALPLVGWAMYVPEVRGNGAEVRLEVGERPTSEP